MVQQEQKLFLKFLMHMPPERDTRILVDLALQGAGGRECKVVKTIVL